MTTAYHVLFCLKQDSSVFTTVNINSLNINTDTTTTVISIAPLYSLTDGALQKSANACFTAVGRLK